ncbi:aminotransferase class IV [Synechocystis sp. PCC 7338]|uniref:aminotransferase class IV n=1 Tax=Synechocystis sp. PCC 7338 TaxID=2732530 RepID=UPI001BAFF825|nr:aminotransferase class IV [Synechocystis sp. PCC 7338]QUS61828.1 aminotransferase class IV [Synechocystis sp. PCC 7338]
MLYWWDGQWFEQDVIQLPVHEPGLLYGATVFTTLRVYQQCLDHPLTHWADHGDRLGQSLVSLQWPAPDWGQVDQAARHLSQRYPLLRLTCFPSGQILITGRELAKDVEQRQKSGINAWLMPPGRYQRSLAELKTGNYFAPWLAQRIAQENNAQEAILTDVSGHWLETATGNLWGWREGEFFTPPLTGQQLPGITLQHLQRWLKKQSITIHGDWWSKDLVRTFQGLAYSNSGVEIVPINRVGEEGGYWLNFASAQSREYDLLAGYWVMNR